MRVLHISNAIGKKYAGGIGDVITAFVSHQKKVVDYIEVWHPNDDLQSIEFAKDTGLPENQIKAFKTIGPNKLGISVQMISQARKDRNKFDIVHQHGIWLPLSLASLQFLKSNAKKVISPHGFLNEAALKISATKKKVAYSLFEKKNLNTADCIHACSSFESDFFRSFGLNQKIALIPNGVDDDFFYAKGNPSLFKSNANLKGKKILLFLSRIHPSKGLDLMLSVLKSLKNKMGNWCFVIAGIDELGHESHLKKIVQDENLHDLVKFIGPVFGQEKVDVFDACDAFVLPTDTENFGIVVAQALARKKPVITTRLAPWKELEDHNCGWWIPKSFEALKETLSSLIELQSQDLAEKGENGFKLISNKYLWNSITANSISLYEYLLEESNVKPQFII